MQELEVVRRNWLLSADIAEGDVPDMVKQYTSIVYRPTAIEIRVTEYPEIDDGETEWSWDDVTIYGHRVLRDGSLGTSIKEVLYSFRDLPEWVDPLITRAMAITGSEPEA